MKITSTEEMRAIDRVTSEKFGVPSLTLMENAGTAVADAALALFGDAGPFVLICGKGNNGGDGFVAARKLKQAGKEVAVYLLASGDEVRGDAAVMFERMGLPFTSITSSEDLQSELMPALARAGVIVDGILGTGSRPPVKGMYAEAIETLNRSSAPIVSVDIPSGADSDSASASAGELVARSDMVVTFTAPRPAHVFSNLTRGPILLAPIGSPNEAICSELKLNVITAPDIAQLFAARDPEGHKGTYGHAMILGGSVGKSGAAAMAGLSALRAGAGLCTVATAKSSLPMVAGYAFELMTEPLAETEAGSIALSALEYGKLDAIVNGKDVLALGPGISRHADTVQFVRNAIGRYRVPLVVDADGLNAFEGAAHKLNGRERPLVITPHPGEMSRLTGLSIKEIEGARVETARNFSQKHDCVVVLKGHRTIVAFPDGEAWINTTGNPGMATGGTGDVLTGLIAGLIAQNRNDLPKAVLGAVYLHGLAGDIATTLMGEHSMIAGDLITYLPQAFFKVRQRSTSRIVALQGMRF